MDAERLKIEAAELGLGLNPEHISSFEAFEEALYAAGAVMNLTRVPQGECWIRHFLDSLLIHGMIPTAARCLDIGCGPGFPCWPLALARPDTQWNGLDSSGKMIGFLAKHRLPNLKPVCDRAESWGVNEQFDVVTGRAVAPLASQLELSSRPCRVGGIVVPMRTPKDLQGLQQLDVKPLGLELEEVRQIELKPLAAMRVFPIFRKVRHTPPTYPRSWAEIKKQPLGS